MVKLVTYPLNKKQVESAKKMQTIQPEIKKIQQQYKDDKEKQNKAVMEYMQKHKVNPMAGCLPLLVQMPILIGIFNLLQKAENFTITNMEGFSPYLFPSIELWNLINPDPIYVFPVLAGVTTFVYQKMSATGTDSSQKMLFYTMPVLLFILSLSLPAGLVLYWTVGNLFSVCQHVLLNLKGRNNGETDQPVSNQEKKELSQGTSEESIELEQKHKEKEVQNKTDGKKKRKNVKKKGKTRKMEAKLLAVG